MADSPLELRWAGRRILAVHVLPRIFAGIAAASWFILADNGERLIRLGAPMRDEARAWRESSDRFFP